MKEILASVGAVIIGIGVVYLTLYVIAYLLKLA